MVRLSFLVPLLAILVLNIIFLVISAIRIATVRKDDTAFKKMKSFVFSCIILTPVLGLSWTIMFLRIATESINWGEGSHVVKFLDWVFILLNGPGGILFFVIVLHRYVQFRKSKKIAGTSRRETTQQHSISTLPRPQRADKYRTNNRPKIARSKHEMSITEEGEMFNVKIENSSLILQGPARASGDLLPPQPDSRPLRPDNPFTASSNTDITAMEKHSNDIIPNPIYSSCDIFFKDNLNLSNSCAILCDESMYKTSQDDIFSPGYFKNLDKSISSSFGKGGAMKSLKKFRSSFHRNSNRAIVKSVISGPTSSNVNIAETSTTKVKSSYQQQMNELLAKSKIKKVFKKQFSSVENLVDSAELPYMDSLQRQGKFTSQGNLQNKQDSDKIRMGSFRLNPLHPRPRPSLATGAAPVHSNKYARHDPLVSTFSSPLPNPLFDGSISKIEKDPFDSNSSKISFSRKCAYPSINIETTTFSQDTTDSISPPLSPIYAVPSKIIISPVPVTQNSNVTNSLQETSFIRPTGVNSLPIPTKPIRPTRPKPIVHIQISPIATLKPERPKPYIRNHNVDSNQDRHRKVSQSNNRISEQVKIFENLAVANYNDQSLTRTKPGPIKKARSYESKRSIEIKPRPRVSPATENSESINTVTKNSDSSKNDTETAL